MGVNAYTDRNVYQFVFHCDQFYSSRVRFPQAFSIVHSHSALISVDFLLDLTLQQPKSIQRLQERMNGYGLLQHVKTGP